MQVSIISKIMGDENCWELYLLQSAHNLLLTFPTVTTVSQFHFLFISCDIMRMRNVSVSSWYRKRLYLDNVYNYQTVPTRSSNSTIFNGNTYFHLTFSKGFRVPNKSCTFISKACFAATYMYQAKHCISQNLYNSHTAYQFPQHPSSRTSSPPYNPSPGPFSFHTTIYSIS